jgi:formate dehydrogenase subunit gamma
VPSYAPWDAEAALAVIADKQSLPGALLPILHALQAEFGYIDREAEPLIADILNLSRAEVHGVITFYHDFRHKPAGRHVLKLCRAESCQARGSDALAARTQARLGTTFGATTADGSVSLEPVYCLGLCSVSPAAMLDGKVFGRLDDRKLDTLLAEADR